MDFAAHPLFQSVLLPAVLALVAGLLAWRLRAEAIGVAACGALAAAYASMPGLPWPPATAALRLAWLAIAAAGLAAVLGLIATTSARRASLPMAVLAAAAAAFVVLGPGVFSAGPVAIVLAGSVALMAIGRGSRAPAAGGPAGRGSVGAPGPGAAGAVAAVGPAVLAAVGLGLAVVVGWRGSMLLAQMAASVAVVSGVVALIAWALPRPGASTRPASLPLAALLLGIVLAAHQSGAAPAVPLAGLALAALVAGLPWRHRAAAGRVAAPGAVALALLPVAAAIGAGIMMGDAPPPTGGDDPYYEPGGR